MKKTYIVAENRFSVAMPDDLSAWATLEPRFKPFEATSDGESVLDITIESRSLSDSDAEEIYEPDHAGIGFITSRVLQLADGRVLLEFKHVAETAPRLQMTLSTEMDKAEIVIAPVGDDCDSYFLTHAIMLAFMIASCGHGTLLFHSSAIIYEGKAYLFQGKSGTGKSTHSRMWLENIEGAELLNDDNPVVRFSAEGVVMAYGSPWSGKTHCYRNIAVPVGAFVRIARAKENNLVQLKPLKAYASLTPSVFSMPFLSDRLREVRHTTLERLVMSVPCCEMHCLPNADAAHTCMNSLLNL